MARSRRTAPPRVTAKRRAARDEDGAILLPRLKERRPHHGDIHPIPPRVLRRCLQSIPDPYLFGLRTIELRPRQACVGEPFGFYLPREKLIVLYSLPMVWHFDNIGHGLAASVRKFGASIEQPNGRIRITWQRKELLALWFFHTVVTHELGHHHVEQYHGKNSRIPSITHEEAVAELHSHRLSVEWFRLALAEIRERRTKP